MFHISRSIFNAMKILYIYGLIGQTFVSCKCSAMKIICIGNYPPRQCGIATFTENLVKAITDAAYKSNTELVMEVIAMNDGLSNYDYPSLVTYSIPDQVTEAYIAAADYINNSGAQLLLLQHEFGIFGGESGVLLLALLRRVNIPIVSTFHTVLDKPNFHQKEILKQIARYSSRIVIMNSIAVGMLEDICKVLPEKILQVEHGVPDYEAFAHDIIAPPASWESRKIMMTFGLIGRSKGIETVIKALPAIVASHPEVLYVVMGKTHPNVIRHSGEEYREYLQELVNKSGLEKHVMFMNQYLSELELMSLLKAAEIYVTPYLNKAQITSGTLCYAVSSGCAVFSTPYWHAEELLKDGKGELFGFGRHDELAGKIIQCLDHPEKLRSMQQKALEHGKTITWPKIGKAYLDVFAQAISNPKSGLTMKQNYPEFSIIHLKRLSDSTGILQHALGTIPSFQHGYSLDDNSRAMLVVTKAFKDNPDPVYLELITVYFSNLLLMWQKDDGFRNFLTYDKKMTEDDSSDDSLGRSIWALGYLIRYAPTDSLFQTAMEVFHNSLHLIDGLQYARGYANCVFGLFHYSRRFPDQERFLHMINRIANVLCLRFEQHNRDHWHWFEDTLTYDNGLIPAALYLAYSLTGNEEHLRIAEKSRIFLEEKCFRKPWLSLIGNRKWLRFDSDYELFAQQPVDAFAMIIMYKSAWLTTRNPEHIHKLIQTYHWFLGDNDLNICVYDENTGGCNDGIESTNINRNQGAESTISWLLSQLIAKPFLSRHYS